MAFQSLFCWIGNGGHLPERRPGPGVPRFNPCSVGLGMAAADVHAARRGRSRVSILVLLDWEWRHAQPRPAGVARRTVSILVLLDWEWRHLIIVDEAHHATRFQSLFCWIGNGGMWSGMVIVISGYVSILVLLDWEWRLDRRGWKLAWRIVFQSLFCWIGNGGAAYIGLTDPRAECFNPCSVGLGMAAFGVAGAGVFMLGVSILVLLDWEWRHRFQVLGLALDSVSILVLLDWEWRPARPGALRVAAAVSILVLLDWEWRLSN